jgi:transposase/FtsZ-binding cell division protein ZapB
MNISCNIYLAFYTFLCYTKSIKGSDFVGGNYGKDLFKQLQETIVAVEKLSAKISSLEKENQELKKRIEVLEKENTALKTENQKLKDIINKDSGNSSKPPSSDGFKKIHNSREKTGKCPGGQFGHKGAAPKLFANPTLIEDIKTTICRCGGRVEYSGDYTAKQLVDVEIVTEITEYREHEGICECCRRSIKNQAPISDVITYGNNLKSVSALLSLEGIVSINRIKQMLCELTNGTINLSEGTIAKWNKVLSVRVTPAIEAIEEKLLTAPVLHKDETGIRVNNTLHWFHVLGNDKLTLYYSHKKRGNDADKEVGILPIYSGVLVHDHLKGLYSFDCDHAECNAHILRYLKAVIENKKRKWAQDMIDLLIEAKSAVDSGGKPLYGVAAEKIRRRYSEILEQGGKEFLKDESPDYNGDDMKLLRRLKEYKTEHLRFISEPNVPFDNNQAERDLRMIKTKTKVSGCFRAEDGGEVFAVLKSYTSTLRKNGRNIFQGIRAAFIGTPVIC